MITKVYQYGLLAPVSGIEAVKQQFDYRQEYKRSLVAAANENRQAKIKVLQEYRPVELESTNAEIESVTKQIEAAIVTRNEARKRDRTKKTPAETAALKQLRTTKKELIARKKAIAANLDQTDLHARSQNLDDAWVVSTKTIRSARPEGLHDGTYNPVEAEVQSAIKTTKLTVDSFIRARRINKVGQQIQSKRPLSYEALFANTDKRCGITIVDGNRAILRLQLQTKPESVCAEFPMTMHRPLPEGGEIKRVDVVRKQIGTRTEWRLLITVKAPAEKRNASSSATVGVDIGWRKQPNGDVLIATVDTGERLYYPARMTEAVKKIEDLQSIRGKKANEAAALINSKIENPRKLVRKYFELGKPEVLAAWYKKDRHLYEWQENLRSRVLRGRRELYRMFAAKLCQRYQSVIFEDMDMRKFKEDDEQAKSIKHNLQKIAIGEMRRMVTTKFQADAWKTDPAYTTRTCNNCKADNPVAGDQVMVTCHSCGVTYDRDINGAKNIRDQGIGEIEAGTARKWNSASPKKKIQRRRRRADDQPVEEVTARDPLATAAE